MDITTSTATTTAKPIARIRQQPYDNMKYYHYLIALIGMMCLVTGCKKTPQQIFTEQKSGVVLICNKFYYEITLNDAHFYFSGLDEDGDFTNFTADLSEIRQNAGVLNGTGFFIDNKGSILTNRHVVAPEIDKATVRKNMNAIIMSYTQYIEVLQDSMNQRYLALQAYAQDKVYTDYDGTSYTSMSQEEYYTINSELESLKEQYQQAQQIKQQLQQNILDYNFEVKLHSQFGIAYDGSSVATWDDFMKNPCTLKRVSQDADSDLALLQLDRGVTPDGKYIFTIDDSNIEVGNKLEINQSLYMIGYNRGVTLAQTNSGISAQFTSGTITQQPDGNRVMYSIPAMQGSSGSPIVDDRGRVVAVNFAGTKGSDNFNFGIPVLRVATFLK